MKKTTKTSPKAPAKKKNTKAQTRAKGQTVQDLKTATLITSVLANLFVLIGWALLQTTTKYNQEVASILFR